jgi:hypothetical protein
MKIRVIKKENRNQLVCVRNDGTTAIADLGPSLPFHDLAHYVVESELRLQQGFFGNIASGFSIEQLSDKNIIRTLPQESTLAEIITRALQSVYSGAITHDQFTEVIHLELEQWSIPLPVLKEDVLNTMLNRYRQLIAEWQSLKEGEHIQLLWK